jgi:hypothetical protein
VQRLQHRSFREQERSRFETQKNVPRRAQQNNLMGAD